MHLSRLKWLLTPLAAIVLITGLVTARQTPRVDARTRSKGIGVKAVREWARSLPRGAQSSI